MPAMARLARAAAALALSALCASALPATAPKYIFTVIVDDLGWGDVGFHRATPTQDVQTPNIDALVAEGVELTRHMVHSMCTPSRSSFLSGRLPVHVQLTLANPESFNAGVPANMTVIAGKMKEAGYKTAVTGKWDAGMATQQHTPEGRGFDESLIYFEHKNSYFDQTLMQSTCQEYNPIVDLWDTGKPARSLNGTQYEEFMFRDRVFSTIQSHNLSEPLFLLYTPHIVHCPLQVPQDQLEKFAFVTDDETACSAQTPYIFPGSTQADFRCRAQYLAMVNLLDGVLGNLTSALKARGMWDETLMILTSDNGGPSAPTESGSNNFPLRGGKYSFFEGGIRATAFVSGGFVPASLRGTQQDGLVHIADWYATLCTLAGVDPTDYVARAGNLPPIDSLDIWPLLSGQNSTSPRTEIPVSESALIQGRYKLLTGPQIEATWSGPSYPNSSSPAAPVDPGPTLKCAAGCLFDVVADPTEHVDIAAQNPALVASMSARLTELSKGFYSNNDTFTNLCPSNITMPCACWAALNTWGGYFGPYAW